MFKFTPTSNSRWTFGADLFVLTLICLLFYYTILLARQWTAAFQPEVNVHLNVSYLPQYTLFSLLRASTAYCLSLLFTLVSGYIAAKSALAERIILPLLDIGQSIPVLGFLPALVLGLIAVFPHTNIGTELACILLIFTGQVWNMAFSFYASLKAIPSEFYELTRISSLSPSRRFTRLELPSSAIPLAWNSLMSMAGGWFFLTVCESFTLKEQNFRLPGLGSYMAVAIEKNNYQAMAFGLLSMVLMIVCVDFLVWRPVIAWTRKFKIDSSFEDIADMPFMALFLGESHSYRFIQRIYRRLAGLRLRRQIQAQTRTDRVIENRASGVALRKVRKRRVRMFRAIRILSRVGIAAIACLTVWLLIGVWELVRPLSAYDWRTIFIDTFFTFSRVLAALLLSTIWTVPFGIWVGSSPRLTKIFQPIIQIAASFPAPMLYPLALALFLSLGIDISIGSTFLMMLGVQWYILFNVLAGAMGISAEMKDSLSLMGIGKARRWIVLYLPSIFPSLVTGWVTAAGGAWNASIVAEYIQSGKSLKIAPGLGSLISVATASGNFPMLAGCLMVMVLTVIGLNRLVWRQLYWFAETRFKFDR